MAFLSGPQWHFSRILATRVVHENETKFSSVALCGKLAIVVFLNPLGTIIPLLVLASGPASLCWRGSLEYVWQNVLLYGGVEGMSGSGRGRPSGGLDCFWGFRGTRMEKGLPEC